MRRHVLLRGKIDCGQLSSSRYLKEKIFLFQWEADCQLTSAHNISILYLITTTYFVSFHKYFYILTNIFWRKEIRKANTIKSCTGKNQHDKKLKRIFYFPLQKIDQNSPCNLRASPKNLRNTSCEEVPGNRTRNVTKVKREPQLRDPSRSQTLRKRTVNVGRCILIFHIDGESMNKICRENALEPRRLRVKRFRVRNSVRATRRGDYNIRVLRAKEAVSSFPFVISRKIFQPGENSRRTSWI